MGTTSKKYTVCRGHSHSAVVCTDADGNTSQFCMVELQGQGFDQRLNIYLQGRSLLFASEREWNEVHDRIAESDESAASAYMEAVNSVLSTRMF